MPSASESQSEDFAVEACSGARGNHSRKDLSLGANARGDALAEQFSEQSLRYDPIRGELWCTLCSDAESATRRQDLNQDEVFTSSAMGGIDHLVWVGRSREQVLAHCARREHLLRYEAQRAGGLEHWCPVELQGHRMVLDRHCVYPATVFGEGRMVMNETLAGGMLVGVDVCGGVKLWPYHKYAVVELVPSPASSFTREVGGSPGTKETSIGVRLFHDLAADEPSPIPKETEREKAKRATVGGRPPHALDVSCHGVCCLPNFHSENQRLRSKRMRSGNLSEVLHHLNASIIGEAKLRERRRQAFIKFNC